MNVETIPQTNVMQRATRRVLPSAVNHKPIALRLLPEELEKVKEVALREQRSMASVCRLAFLRGFADSQKSNLTE